MGLSPQFSCRRVCRKSEISQMRDARGKRKEERVALQSGRRLLCALYMAAPGAARPAAQSRHEDGAARAA
eukprot:scaffold80496_cov29-Tisochrysis_lutea.AAC.3